VTENQVCRKVRIFPNKEQRELLERCANAHRYFYNQANRWMKDQLDLPKEERSKGYTCLPTARKAVLTPDKQLTEENMWQKEVPYDTRQLAIKALLAAYKTSFALAKKGLVTHFDVSYKRKHSPTKEFYVDKKALNVDTLCIFPRRLKAKSKLRTRKRIKRSLAEIMKDNSIQDFVVTRNAANHWHLCLPYKKKASTYVEPKYQDVFLDPGVRTFNTFYSPEGVCGKLGDRYVEGLMKDGVRVDMFTSNRFKKTDGDTSRFVHSKKTRKNMKRRCSLLRTKIKNRVSDLHWKSASVLTDNFQNIYIPSFESQSMAGSENRLISSRSVRKMLTLSHYSFRMKLEHMCRMKGRRLTVVTEEFTSKTCGMCGVINAGLGGDRMFRCSHCENTIDRDLGAARNICLKVFTERA
jgi:putative transposase